MEKTRILIVDDSPFVRRILKDMFSRTPDLEVVGVATNGLEGIEQAKILRPDVITLDVEMPNMSGLEALPQILASHPVPVIMVSSLTARGTQASVQALQTGAFEIVCKPNNGAFTALHALEEELVSKIRAARSVKISNATFKPVKAHLPAKTSDKVVVVASSTGGPKALSAFVQGLPAGFRNPIVIVQHIPAGFIESLAARLSKIGTVPCVEAKPGFKVSEGVVMFAPGGFHMEIDKSGEFVFNEEPSLHGVKPAADYLFKSAAKIYKSRTVGVVLTGMGKDGAAGAVAIREAGGIVLGECESTCTVYGMPRAAKEAGGINSEFPIDQMGSALVAAVSGRNSAAA